MIRSIKSKPKGTIKEIIATERENKINPNELIRLEVENQGD